jgi:hypothetical protein
MSVTMGTAPRPTSGWYTGDYPSGKAHLYDAEGKTSCGDRKGIWPDGTKLVDLFTRATRPAKPDDHHCVYCSKAEAKERVCMCWSCQAKRRGLNRP